MSLTKTQWDATAPVTTLCAARYVSIARECFGAKWGGMAVNAAQIIELLMTCILYVVVCGDLMIGVFPEGAIDARSWMMMIGKRGAKVHGWV